MSKLQRFVDFFLPPSMRSNPSDLMRGYVLLGLITINSLICSLMLLVVLFYFTLGYTTPLATLLTVTALFAYVATLMLLKRTQSHVLSSNFILTVLTTIYVVGIQITGGHEESPILQMLLHIPIMAFLLLGLRRGIYWLLIVFLISIATYTSASLQWGFAQLLPDQAVRDTMQVSLEWVLLLVTGAALIIYESINGLLNRKLNEERDRFRHKASHDDLTGVTNRFEFFRRLRLAVDEATRRGHKVGIVYIDLDGFKAINDEHGHHAGDEVLKAVAERIRRVVRMSDTASRLGGDEFGLILPGINLKGDIDDILTNVLAAIGKPVRIGDLEVSVRGSCGVSIFPSHGEDDDNLCRYADIAMYRAKRQQEGYLVFTQDMLVEQPMPA